MLMLVSAPRNQRNTPSPHVNKHMLGFRILSKNTLFKMKSLFQQKATSNNAHSSCLCLFSGSKILPSQNTTFHMESHTCIQPTSSPKETPSMPSLPRMCHQQRARLLHRRCGYSRSRDPLCSSQKARRTGGSQVPSLPNAVHSLR